MAVSVEMDSALLKHMTCNFSCEYALFLVASDNVCPIDNGCAGFVGVCR